MRPRRDGRALAFEYGGSGLSVENEVARLVRVIEAIELADSGWRGIVVLAEVFGLAVRVVPVLYEVIPLFQRIECFHAYQDIVTNAFRVPRLWRPAGKSFVSNDCCGTKGI